MTNISEDLLRNFEDDWWAAARKGDEFKLREMLGGGAEVLSRSADNDGRTALHYVCGLGSERLARLLLDCGADPRAGDKDGYTALHIASGYVHAKVVRALLEYGADPEQIDKVRTLPAGQRP